MLRQQLRQDLILGLDLLLQIVNPFLLGCMVRPRFRLEGSRPVLEELNRNSAARAAVFVQVAHKFAQNKGLRKRFLCKWRKNAQSGRVASPSGGNVGTLVAGDDSSLLYMIVVDSNSAPRGGSA